MTKVSIIVAMGQNREIGKNNDLMWHLPVDMRFFKETTLGHPVIMGRKNYESIPEQFRPFKNRLNIVVSNQKEYQAPGCHLFQNISQAIEFAKTQDDQEVFVIGGGQIYTEALKNNWVDTMYITHIQAEFSDAHTFFPEVDLQQWHKKLIMQQGVDDRHQYAFSVFEYSK
ncbi:MAG: hypothetical protein RL062_1060 [Bacteroidota bacterium]